MAAQENALPSVRLSSPVIGAVVPVKNMIALQATPKAEPQQGIDHVAYYLNGVFVGKSSIGPTFDVGYQGKRAGKLSFTAIASQWNGKTASSPPVCVTVQ